MLMTFPVADKKVLHKSKAYMFDNAGTVIFSFNAVTYDTKKNELNNLVLGCNFFFKSIDKLLERLSDNYKHDEQYEICLDALTTAAIDMFMTEELYDKKYEQIKKSNGNMGNVEDNKSVCVMRIVYKNSFIELSFCIF